MALLGLGFGFVAAVVSGNRPAEVVRRLRLLRVRYWPVLILAAVLSLAVTLDANMLAGRFALGISLALLLAGCLLNQHIAGARIVAVGAVANLAVLLVNGYLPMSESAVVAADIIDFEGLERVLLGAARRWSDDATIAAWLGGAVPIAPLRDVVSLGDLVTAAGLANVGFRLMSPTARHRYRRELAARRHGGDHEDASVVLRPAGQAATLEQPALADAAPLSPATPLLAVSPARVRPAAAGSVPEPSVAQPSLAQPKVAQPNNEPAWLSRVEPAPWPAPAPWPREWGPGERGPGENGPGENGPGENGLREWGPSEIMPNEVMLAEAVPDEMGLRRVWPDEAAPGESQAGELWSDDSWHGEALPHETGRLDSV